MIDRDVLRYKWGKLFHKTIPLSLKSRQRFFTLRFFAAKTHIQVNNYYSSDLSPLRVHLDYQEHKFFVTPFDKTFSIYFFRKILGFRKHFKSFISRNSNDVSVCDAGPMFLCNKSSKYLYWKSLAYSITEISKFIFIHLRSFL